jgi:hypothetical protein
MFPNGWLGSMPAISIFVLADPQQELGAPECLVRIDIAFQGTLQANTPPFGRTATNIRHCTATRTMPIHLPQGTEQIMYHRRATPITVLDAFQQFRSDLLAHFLSNDEIIRRRLVWMLTKHLPPIQACCEVLNREERKFFCRSVAIVNRTAGYHACRFLGIPESEIEEELQNLQGDPLVSALAF